MWGHVAIVMQLDLFQQDQEAAKLRAARESGHFLPPDYTSLKALLFSVAALLIGLAIIGTFWAIRRYGPATIAAVRRWMAGLSTPPQMLKRDWRDE